MALTRKFLKNMGLTAQQVDEIIAAHLESLDGAKSAAQAEQATLAARLQQQETDAAARLAEVQSAFDGYRRDVSRREKSALLVAALVDAGANPAAAPLMAQSVDLDALEIADGQLSRLPETVDGLRAAWRGLFCEEAVSPLPAVDPYLAAPAVLTRQDVAAMSPEDVNRHWSAVSAALRDQL
ncbi:MAG: hypothetical protein IKK21_12155 [Clostridia bacterium]|nr:hypothetical protein [Clostridia bacterium]